MTRRTRPVRRTGVLVSLSGSLPCMLGSMGLGSQPPPSA